MSVENSKVRRGGLERYMKLGTGFGTV
ncbi:hypothetical protein VTJ04DRAFT_5512 [Mycothermus thermophilus]